MSNDETKKNEAPNNTMETDPYLEGVSDAFDEVRELLLKHRGIDDAEGKHLQEMIDALQKQMMEGSTPTDDTITVRIGKKAAAFVGSLLTSGIVQGALTGAAHSLFYREMEKRGREYAATKDDQPCARATCQHGRKRHHDAKAEAFGYLAPPTDRPTACAVTGCGCVGYVSPVPETEKAP